MATRKLMTDKKRFELVRQLFGVSSISEVFDIGEGLRIHLKGEGKVSSVYLSGDTDKTAELTFLIDSVLLSVADNISQRLGNWRNEGCSEDD